MALAPGARLGPYEVVAAIGAGLANGTLRPVEGLRITGQMKGDVDWPKYVDTSYLPADLRPVQLMPPPGQDC